MPMSHGRGGTGQIVLCLTIVGSGRERNSCLLPLMICLVPYVASNTGGTKCGEASIIRLCMPGIRGEV